MIVRVYFANFETSADNKHIPVLVHHRALTWPKLSPLAVRWEMRRTVWFNKRKKKINLFACLYDARLNVFSDYGVANSGGRCTLWISCYCRFISSTISLVRARERGLCLICFSSDSLKWKSHTRPTFAWSVRDVILIADFYYSFWSLFHTFSSVVDTIR